MTITATHGLEALIASHVAGRGLARGFYLDPDVFEADLADVFAGTWLFAGHLADVPDRGDYRVVEVAGESLLLWHGGDGAVRAFHNVCRHRGARLATQCAGNAAALRCGYHQWTYRSTGALAGARLMGDGFEPRRWPLLEVAVEVLDGLVFVCLGDDPPDIGPARAALHRHLAPYELAATRVLVRERYTVEANWKIVVENNRECYHCLVCHPEFTLTNYDLGLPGDDRAPDEYTARRAEARSRWRAAGLATDEESFVDGQWYRIARLPLKPGFVTETLSGRPAAPLLGRLDDPDAGSVRIIGLPNFWAHVNSDYAMTTRLNPVTPERTDVEVTFLVRSDAMLDADADDVATVLRATFEQDVELCEQVAAGVRSRAYVPGPYSPLTEASVDQFVTWYLHRLGARAAAYAS